MLSYNLSKNHFDTEGDSYKARVQYSEAKNEEAIIDHMIKEGSTTTKTDALAVLNDFDNSLAELLLAGHTINTKLFTLRLTIRGTFDGPDDKFDSTKHTINLAAGGTRSFNKRLQIEVRVNKGRLTQNRPIVESYLNAVNGAKNSTISPNTMGIISGDRLQFDPQDPLQGLFFVDSNQVATRVVTAGRITSSEVIFTVPAGLAAGSYVLQVRALFGKNMRTGSLDQVLTVA